VKVQDNINKLINNYLEGIAGEPELKFLIDWLQYDKYNIRYFNQLCIIWEQTGVTGIREKETNEALEKLKERIKIFENENQQPSFILDSSPKRTFGFQRVAAIALILIGLSFATRLTVIKLKDKFSPVSTGGYYTIMAPKNQKSRLILIDGTKVWLNCGTSLKYKADFGIDKREVYLNGEAYFEVAKDPAIPFFVHASSVVVKAIGTSFNVKCYPEDKTIETTLFEGKVKVYRSNFRGMNSGSVFLMPNEKATFIKKDSKLIISRLYSRNISENELTYKPVRIYTHSVESVISWKDQELVFENEPFDELAKRLERWYNVSIDIKDSSKLIGNRYTGKFLNNESLEQVLQIISRTTPIRYTVLQDKVTIEVKK